MDPWLIYLHNLKDRERNLIFDFLGREKKLKNGIEFGCGDGYQTKYLSQYFEEFTATDLNFKRIREENKVPKVTYVEKDADELCGSFGVEQYDVVFSSTVLEHLGNPDSFLTESNFFLKDDGFAIHTVPTRFLKIMYVVFFYFYIFRLAGNRLLGLIEGKPIFRGSKISQDNNINKIVIRKEGRLRKFLVPQIHGNYKTHFEEWRRWGVSYWQDMFDRNGYVIVRRIKGPAFTGYGFQLDFFRKLVEKVGLCSEHIFILKKKKSYQDLFKNPNLALILPNEKGDYLTNGVIDGLIEIGETDFRVTDNYPCPYDISNYELNEIAFKRYSEEAKAILFFRLDAGRTRFDLAEEINLFDKTVFMDGSELKDVDRNDPRVIESTVTKEYKGFGSINWEMLNKCVAYFRREKPYLDGVTPLPYGIESRYLKAYQKDITKDIDFVCIFGQEDHPSLRKDVRIALEEHCQREGLVCVTKKTKGFNFGDRKTEGRDEFYKILARAKVGVSVSGGGYDTARFWETLGNNCLLLTEKIDIWRPEDRELEYKRIWQFDRNVNDFKKQLSNLSDYLRTEYQKAELNREYAEILSRHSTKARATFLLSRLNSLGLLQEDNR